MIRVLLVLDTGVTRAALAAVLGQDAAIDVEEATLHEAPYRLRSSRPDVCVVDAECAGTGGRRALPDLFGSYARETVGKVLVLVPAGKPGLMYWAHRARARGFVDADGTPAALAQAIRRVAEGERIVDGTLAPGLLDATERPMTPRELSVLELAAEGTPIAEIAGCLHLSHGTVRNYLADASRKLGARNRVDAIRLCRRAGWI
ncbi:response regulator transcription factor [Streptomyces sp. NPDC048172]|uniref:response regulator transcription factor n=1 Tax=Streptomyces sp. NPDC048172 TaxID=3365505 RepID=UPI00371B3EB1